MKHLSYTILCFLLLCSRLGAQSKDPDCDKNILFYFDLTESIFGYTDPPISKGLKDVTELMLNDESTIKDGYGFSLFEFAEETNEVVPFQVLNSQNRSIIIGSVRGLTGRTAEKGGRYNNYEKLFNHMGEQVESHKHYGSNRYNYIFLFTDLFYDDNGEGGPKETIKSKSLEAYKTLLNRLKETRFKLVIVSYPNFPKPPKPGYQFFDVAERIINAEPDPYNLVEIIDCNRERAVCEHQNAGLLWERLKGMVDEGRLEIMGNGKWIHNDGNLTLGLELRNNSCESIHFDSLRIKPIRYPGHSNLDFTSPRFFNSQGGELLGQDRVIPPQGILNIVGEFTSQKSMGEMVEAENVVFDMAPVEFYLDGEKAPYRDTIFNFNIKVGVPKPEMLKVFDIRAGFFEPYQKLRIVYRALKPLKQEAYFIEFETRGDGGCTKTIKEKIRMESNMEGEYSFDIPYEGQCIKVENDSLRAKVRILDQNGQIIGIEEEYSMLVVMASTWGTFIWISIIMLVLGGILVGLRLHWRRMAVRILSDYHN